MFGGLQQGLKYREGLQNKYDDPQPESDGSNPVSGEVSSAHGTVLRTMGETVDQDQPPQTAQGKKCQDNILKDLTTFNNLLQKYNAGMKGISEDVMKNRGAANSSLLGTNVIVNKTPYYINKFGYPQKYQDSGPNSFSNRGPNCNKSTTALAPTSAQWENFKDMLGKGPQTFNNNSCGLEGELLSNGGSSYGYVDITNNAYKFGEGQFDKLTEPTCKGTATSVGSEFDDLFKGAGTYTPGQPCLRMPINPNNLNELDSTNKSLLQLIQAIEKENECLQQLETSNNKQITENLKKIAVVKKQLAEDSSAFSQLKSGKNAAYSNDGVNLNLDLLQSTSESALNNSELFVNMNYMRYIIGFVIVCIVGFFTIRYWGSDKQPLFVTILSIGLVAYIVWIYFLSRIHIKFK